MITLPFSTDEEIEVEFGHPTNEPGDHTEEEPSLLFLFTLLK